MINSYMPKKPVTFTALVLLAGLASAGAVAGCDASNEPTKAATVQARAKSAVTDEASPTAADTPKRSSAANEDRYEVRSPEGPIAVGQKQKVELAIRPGDGLKINKEFPWKLEFSAPTSVELAQKKVAGAQIDLAESQATIPLFLEASADGEHRLEATADFSVCNDTKCWVIRDEPLHFALKAEAPQAPENGAAPK